MAGDGPPSTQDRHEHREVPVDRRRSLLARAGAAGRCGLVAAAVGLSLLGCSRGPQGLGSVRLVYHHAMVTLDPHAHNDAVTGTVLGSVYDPLVHHVPGQPFRPALAVNWTTPSDTRGFRFDPG